QSVHKRIPCPLDPKHTCFENKLSSHMKICNARERMDKPFFVKRINEGENEDGDGDESCGSSSPLKDLTDEELMEYIRKIEKIYDGKLTGWVIEAVKKKEEPLFILIDKGSQRYKIDAKLKHE
ncbi:tRNA:m(4)X modification enzyme TRM13-like protein, partial [Armadillidium vulgare]